MTQSRKPDAAKPPQTHAKDRSVHREGTNAVEHEPDPKAEPLPDSEHKFIEKSPYTAGSQ